jgi:hypothetical protein
VDIASFGHSRRECANSFLYEFCLNWFTSNRCANNATDRAAYSNDKSDSNKAVKESPQNS